MQILTSHLKAALLAAAKKDKRFYLNAILINERHIVGLDGHRMHVIAHRGEWPHGTVIIPRAAVEIALKLKQTALEVTPTALGSVGYTAIDAVYPAYLRVMADLNSGAQVAPVIAYLNPDYLRDAHEAVRLVTGIKDIALSRVSNCWAWSVATIQCIIQPTRSEAVYAFLEPLA